MDKDIGQLLSWYVNGTLTRADRDRVEAVLREDVRANALLEWERSLRNAVQNDPAVEIADDRGLAQVMQRIRADARPAAVAAPAARKTKAGLTGSVARLSEWFRWSPALAMACGIVAVQFGIIAHMYTAGGEESQYSGLRSVTAKRAEVFVRVTFEPESTESDLRVLIRGIRAEIVSGPSQLGDYYLVVTPDSVQCALTVLQSSSLVDSAEMVNALPSRPS